MPASSHLASQKHTAGLILIIAAFAVAGRLAVGPGSAAWEQFGRQRIYSVALLSEWVLAGYVFLGVKRRLPGLIEQGRLTPRRLARYVAVAVAAFLVWGGFAFLLGKLHLFRLSPEDIRHMSALLPQRADWLLWTALALSAGFCEELVYRGYLLRQFQAATRSVWAALVLQAVVYGVAHAALPWQIGVTVTFLGALFGAVAVSQNSLVPGMLLHAGMDLLPIIASRS